MRISLSFVVLALAVLLVGHQVVYLATYGAPGVGQALSSVGHDTYWLLTAVSIGTALGVGVLVGLRRWLTLRAQLNRLPRRARQRASIDWTRFSSSVIRLAPRLAVTALIVFFFQENLEHATHGAGQLPGLSVLIGGEYVGTLPIFALVAALIAAIVSLLRLGLAVLEDQLERAARPRPGPNPPLPAGWQLPLYRWSRSAPDLGRAPPSAA